MTIEQLVVQLKTHLKTVEKQATPLYISRLNKTIQNLERGFYSLTDDILVQELQTLGFQDIAMQVRRSQYI